MQSENDLCVRGVKLNINRVLNDTVKYDLKRSSRRGTDRTATTASRQKNEHLETIDDPYRKTFELKTINLSSKDVCDGRLKQVRESVRLDDLKGLLRLLNPIEVPERPIERKKRDVDVGDVYEEFFQSHYDYLRSRIEEDA